MMPDSFIGELKSAGSELGVQFIDLIGSLSTMHELMRLDVRLLDERTLVRHALIA
ncbi:hypothetical protein [Methylogaea oryzae]|nr:hypothetical protein [Methylogaea oryzae]